MEIMETAESQLHLSHPGKPMSPNAALRGSSPKSPPRNKNSRPRTSPETPDGPPYGHAAACPYELRTSQAVSSLRTPNSELRTSPPPLIAHEGRNCWRRPRADRLAFLIDGEAYFSAVAAAMERAEHSILILGWDIASRVWLRRDGTRHSQPDELGPLLHEVLSRRKKLRVHILSWDFAMIYVLEREFLPIFKLPWRTHRRLRFLLDGNHPSGGSHHQKIVVVDDSVAFSGGFDLTNHRWDTPEHKTGEPRRVNPGGIQYEPFHDVQVAVSGEAAAALGDLARERWRRATGTSISPPPSNSDSWPRHLSPDLEDVRVAIARTEPEWKGQPGVREVENLFLDMIAAARSSIYIENQYFTSARICQALIERLLTPEGPEIIMVVARENSGWLEKNSMGIIRSQLLQKLKRADQFGRLFVYNPSLPGGERMEVHSKIMVVDDAVARVGSANLSNRSMRLDTECDIMIESAGEERVSRGVAGFRDRLLGEHLGISPERVQDAIRREGSPARAVEALGGGNRTLAPMEVSMEPLAENICLDAEFCDPEHPVSPEMIVSHMLPDEFKRPAIRRLPWVIGFMVALSCLAVIWRWVLGDWVWPEELLKQADVLWKMPLAPLLIVGAYLLASLFLIPLTVMVLLTGFLLGPLYGFLYAWAGSLSPRPYSSESDIPWAGKEFAGWSAAASTGSVTVWRATASWQSPSSTSSRLRPSRSLISSPGLPGSACAII